MRGISIKALTVASRLRAFYRWTITARNVRPRTKSAPDTRMSAKINEIPSLVKNSVSATDNVGTRSIGHLNATAKAKTKPPPRRALNAASGAVTDRVSPSAARFEDLRHRPPVRRKFAGSPPCRSALQPAPKSFTNEADSTTSSGATPSCVTMIARRHSQTSCRSHPCDFDLIRS